MIGAILQLGNCLDLMDLAGTSMLRSAFEAYRAGAVAAGVPLPSNRGDTPDRKLRMLDCAVVNFLLERAEEPGGTPYDSVRCAFAEGGPAFEESGISAEGHIQLAIRRPHCIIGVFRPSLGRK